MEPIWWGYMQRQEASHDPDLPLLLAFRTAGPLFWYANLEFHLVFCDRPSRCRLLLLLTDQPTSDLHHEKYYP